MAQINNYRIVFLDSHNIGIQLFWDSIFETIDSLGWEWEYAFFSYETADSMEVEEAITLLDELSSDPNTLVFNGWITQLLWKFNRGYSERDDSYIPSVIGMMSKSNVHPVFETDGISLLKILYENDGADYQKNNNLRLKRVMNLRAKLVVWTLRCFRAAKPIQVMFPMTNGPLSLRT